MRKINTEKKLIKRIISYDFAKADYDKLPSEIFKIDSQNLSPMQRAILNVIKFQIKVSNINMRYQYIKQHISFNNISGTQFESVAINQLPKMIFTGTTITIVGFILLSLTYYANVNLHLGMTFLTNMFA